MVKVVILWTAPRSLSSAVYQAMTTLKFTSVKCFFELYMYPWFFDSHSDVCPTETLPVEPTYTAVNKTLLQDYPNTDLVFSKEMAKCLPPIDSPEYHSTLQEFKHALHVFLIRDPANVVYSRHKISQAKVVGHDANIGLMELYKLYNYIQANFDSNPAVFDASDIQNNPPEMMRLLCESIGIPFEPHMTTWEAGKSDIKMPFAEWDKYFETLRSSSGFITVPYSQQRTVPMDQLTPEMVEYIEECRPYYELLKAKCIRPQ